MRRLAAFAVIFLLAACGDSTPEVTAVDTSKLPPMSARERALLISAENALRQNNLEVAERDYRGAVADSKGHVDAHVGLAQVYNRMKQQGKAKDILEQAQKLQPNNPGVNYLLGKNELNAGNYSAALAAFQRGLINAPNDLDLNNGAGVAHDMLGEHRAAQAIYTPAISRNKGRNLSAIRTNLGMSYLLTNEPKKALPILQSEAKNPNASLTTRHNLALAYGLLGRTSEARAALKGDGDEPTRVTTLERLKAYLADTSPNKKPPQLSPTVKAAPVEAVD